MIRFAVELDEKEMTGNKKFSGEQLFKTAGQAKVVVIIMNIAMMVLVLVMALVNNQWLFHVLGVEIECQRLHCGLPLEPSPSSNLSLPLSSSHHHHVQDNNNHSQVSDLRLASVSFPRSAIEHASCLDYIQVTNRADIFLTNIKSGDKLLISPMIITMVINPNDLGDE